MSYFCKIFDALSAARLQNAQPGISVRVFECGRMELSQTMMSAGTWSARLLLAGAVMVITMRCYAGAGISTDGSVGARAIISGLNAGPGNYLIPQTLGTFSGNNLFHSFSTFNVDAGQSATFNTTTNTLANVISRVTGGSASQINGTLQLTSAAGSAPAFFFINPAGVVFGAGASIEVPGAFHVSTADYVKFADGSFHADTSKVSTFSSAAPEAFGFLGASRSTVVVKDAILQSQSGNLSIVAGDVQIDHAGVLAESGKIKVVATGSGAREISTSQELPVVDGLLEISNGGFLYTESKSDSIIGGGNIEVAAGDARITDGGGIATATSGERPAGSIRAELGSLLIDGRIVPTTPSGITSQAAISDTGAVAKRNTTSN
jgi:filamentous hemagglutinin family protein